MANIPDNLRYTESDEWVAADGRVGISDYAQGELGDIVDLELLIHVGQKVSQGDEIANIDSVKASSPIMAPVDGEVVEVNEGLPDECSVINEDPYEKGWMIKINMSDSSQRDALLDAAAYVKKIGQ